MRDPFEQPDSETDALGDPRDPVKAVPLGTPYPTYPGKPAVNYEREDENDGND